MVEAPAWQQVRPDAPKFPRRTATQHKPPARLVAIIQVLNRIENRGYRLRLIHENELSLLVHRQAPAFIRERSGVGQMPRPLLGISQVNHQRLRRQQCPEKRGLPRLPRPEDKVDIRSCQLLAQNLRLPTVKHRSLYIQTRNLKSSSEWVKG